MKRWIFILSWNAIATILNTIAFAINSSHHHWFVWISFALAIICGFTTVFIATHKENYAR